MNERSFTICRQMPPANSLNGGDRPTQILNAAIACFAKRGFHQTSMHDISAEAEISVGLIYRYFRNKEAVIAAMAERYKKDIQALLERARRAPTLLESLEILFTAHCCENAPKLHSAFVVDLYAEAARNDEVANLVRDMLETAMDGVADVIARAPEMCDTPHDLTAHEITDLIFATARGTLMRDVLENSHTAPAERRQRQLAVVRNLWRLLFAHGNKPALA